MHYTATREPHEVRGYVSMPTGSGKTVVFAEAVKQLNLPTLVLVPTTQLVDQTLEQLKKRLPDKNINAHTGWRRDTGQHDVLVATYAALARKVGEMPFSVDPQNYQLVIMDEAHRSMGTMSRRYIEENLYHAMHLGFTATEDYSNERRLANYLYDEIHKISVSEAVEIGLIAPYRVVSLRTEGDMSTVSIKIDDYDQVELGRVMERPERDERIIDYYVENLAGEKAMLNVNSIQHAERLAEDLQKRGIRAAAIYGAQSKQTQKTLLRALSKGEIMALTQAKLLGEGFDEPSLGVVINVTPTMSYVRSQQRSGRALRLDPSRSDKVALIVECVDDNYVRSPAYFGDENVAGSYGVDGFAGAESVVRHYRGAAPTYKSLQEVVAANIPVASESSQKSPRKTKAKRQIELRTLEGVRHRREQRAGNNLDELEGSTEGDFMQLDLERFCATNLVANYIVNGIDVGDTKTGRPMMRAALGQLAGSDVLEDPDVLTRYVLAQNLYKGLEQKSHHSLGGLGLEGNIEPVREYSEEDVRLALVIRDAQAQLPAWRHDGACSDLADDRFFPERGQSTRPAKDICAGCRVREMCLEYALENGERFGIWGGSSDRERRRMRRQRKLAAAASNVIDAVTPVQLHAVPGEA